MSEQPLFLYLEIQNREVLTEKWRLYEEYTQEAKVSPARAASTTITATASEKTALPEAPADPNLTKSDDPSAPPGPGPTGKRRGQTAEAKGPASKKAKGPDDMALSMKLKHRYLAISTKAKMLVTSISTEKAWAWAKIEVQVLSKKLQELEEAVRSSGSEAVLQQDPKELRSMPGDSLSVLLKTWLLLDMPVSELETEHGKLLRMQKARGTGK